MTIFTALYGAWILTLVAAFTYERWQGRKYMREHDCDNAPWRE